MNGKICVRRVGVISVAKLQGALYGLLGLLIGAVVSLISIVGSAIVGSTTHSNTGALGGILVGGAAVIIFPILYGLIGFVGGLIVGFLYNLVAGIVGGIELELAPPKFQ